MWWQVGFAGNFILFVVYMAIAFAILVPLVKSGQLWTNRLGSATALIFFSCGVGHALHAEHLALPTFGVGGSAGTALRESLDWHVAVWDLLTACVGIYYWTLRRTYGSLMLGAKLFEDLRERQRQALQINDEIVQGLTEAHVALLLDEKEVSQEALEQTLASARDLISDLLGSTRPGGRPQAGDLLRDRPARVPGGWAPK